MRAAEYLVGNAAEERSIQPAVAAHTEHDRVGGPLPRVVDDHLRRWPGHDVDLDLDAATVGLGDACQDRGRLRQGGAAELGGRVGREVGADRTHDVEELRARVDEPDAAPAREANGEAQRVFGGRRDVHEALGLELDPTDRAGVAFFAGRHEVDGDNDGREHSGAHHTTDGDPRRPGAGKRCTANPARRDPERRANSPTPVAQGRDLYAILGVAREAAPDEIRRAYRKLARKWHPDVNPGNPEAEERFKEISAANEVLSDPESRKRYDEFGEESLAGGFDPEKARAYRRWAESQRATAHDDGHVPFEFDIADLFWRGGAGPTPRARGGRDVLVSVELDFVQALRGSEFEVRVPRAHTCETCAGSGNEPGTTPRVCEQCSGTGRTQAVRGPMRIMSFCPACGGTGQRRTPCHTCAGEGSTPVEEAVRVRISPGADDGTELRVRGKGELGTGGSPDGDLVVVTRVRPHPHFQRDGLDLTLQLPVTLDEAYCGARIDVPTPDGPVQMKVPPRSQPGTRLRLRGKGVERGKARGDLYVVLAVRLPEERDENLERALRDAAALYRRPVREGIEL